MSILKYTIKRNHNAYLSIEKKDSRSSRVRMRSVAVVIKRFSHQTSSSFNSFQGLVFHELATLL
jgi:hypothetical protein